MVTDWQVGHTRRSPSQTFSRHPRQKTCRHESTRGCANVSLQRPQTVVTGELQPTMDPVVEVGGELSRDGEGSESIREPKGVPERDSSEGVGEPTDILNH